MGTHSSTWNKREREELNPEAMWSFSCQRGVWDAGLDNTILGDVPKLLTQNRRGKCFFIEHAPGMTYRAASDLHAHRQSQKPNRLSKVAIILAALSAAATIAVSLLTQTGIFPI